MRLIDADALVEAIKDYPYGFRGMIVCDIAKQPTIEPKRDIKHTESISLISTDAEPKREIEEIKAQAYAEGFTTALGAILDMLKGATKYENCKLYNEGYKDGSVYADPSSSPNITFTAERSEDEAY